MQFQLTNSILKDFAIVTPKNNYHTKIISDDEKILICICNDFEKIGFNCLKCKRLVHNCLERKPNRSKDRLQCVSCLNLSLDPLHMVRKVLLETYFRTEGVYDMENLIIFPFRISNDDVIHPVEVRALRPGRSFLKWPMQGLLYINNEKMPISELRPLKSNSNRKTRREEFLVIPHSLLRLGDNYLKFYIPLLDKKTYSQRYQCQQRGTYYFAINSVVEISTSQLITQTFKKRRLTKKQSLKLLTSGGDIAVTQQKVFLICPYTKERIKIPVRGKYCKHYSCFCLMTLVATHRQYRQWNCPICEEKINEPYVDEWIYDILMDGTQGNTVEIYQNGTYKWLQSQKMAVQLENDNSQQEIDLQEKNEIKKVTEAMEDVKVEENVDEDVPIVDNVIELEEVQEFQEVQQIQQASDIQQSEGVQQVHESSQVHNEQSQQRNQIPPVSHELEPQICQIQIQKQELAHEVDHVIEQSIVQDVFLPDHFLQYSESPENIQSSNVQANKDVQMDEQIYERPQEQPIQQQNLNIGQSEGRQALEMQIDALIKEHEHNFDSNIIVPEENIQKEAIIPQPIEIYQPEIQFADNEEQQNDNESIVEKKHRSAKKKSEKMLPKKLYEAMRKPKSISAIKKQSKVQSSFSVPKLLKADPIKISLLEDISSIQIREIKPKYFRQQICRENVNYRKKIQNIIRSEKKYASALKELFD